ncbi:head GIN domain-containing protein [Xanthomarina spongicola]|uniref:Putative autotransporter adhesin-like protein n=1 Tax=Xanthomarina spongicola TaxID=570520 RepID=A0A316DSE9_9FLAO|nr:head GIN domain-containing protein [Xanthomarina spongicola]PWK21021.1 putative autotransporter adhesin-like protein [Xanthomarina spongicola]
MKKLVYIFLLVFLFACDSEDANDCFQKSGNIIQQEVVVEPFEKILVNRNIELILKEDLEFSLVIETGENLMNDVEVVVIDNQLRLTDNNSCNYVRDYEPTKIYVSAPNITNIRSSTQFDISSDGVLNYNNLKLFSEDFNSEGAFTMGDFRLQVNANNLRVTANNLSSFYISGETNKLYVGFFSGTGRFEGANLTAQEVSIYHRGSNDIIVNPQQLLTGELRGTGDLISKNNPPNVEVEQFYTGELIFE